LTYPDHSNTVYLFIFQATEEAFPGFLEAAVDTKFLLYSLEYMELLRKQNLFEALEIAAGKMRTLIDVCASFLNSS
tara:strand:+ start:520 stop:747 length:228 start_codon:yes stop_codon:yes gene_type:complete